MNDIFKLCDYGCGNKAKYYFKYVDKWCCSTHYTKCPISREKNKIIQIGIKRSDEARKHISIGKKNYFQKKENKLKYSIIHQKRCKNMTDQEKKNLAEKRKGSKNGMWGKTSANRLTVNKIKHKYPFFSQMEEMRYNPDKPGEKEIQVHCKYLDCPNSKENNGWFTPTPIKMSERIRNLEKHGLDNSYFYCSDECKQKCNLFNLRSDLYKDEIEKPYTQEEYNIWKQTVLEQDKYECQKCGSKENLHCHHINPIKVDPMLSLDPENGIVLCEKCHYEIGHKTGTKCSTGNLANKICISNKLVLTDEGKKFEQFI